MKKALFVIGGIALAIGGSWAIWKYVILPKKKLSFPNIDWDKRIVEYEAPIQSGKVSFDDLVGTTKTINAESNGIQFDIYAGVDSLVFSIRKGLDAHGLPKLVERKTIDFAKHKILEYYSTEDEQKTETAI